MVDDKVARRSLWVGELACSSRAYHINKFLYEAKLIPDATFVTCLRTVRCSAAL